MNQPQACRRTGKPPSPICLVTPIASFCPEVASVFGNEMTSVGHSARSNAKSGHLIDVGHHWRLSVQSNSCVRRYFSKPCRVSSYIFQTYKACHFHHGCQGDIVLPELLTGQEFADDACDFKPSFQPKCRRSSLLVVNKFQSRLGHHQLLLDCQHQIGG